MKQVGIFVPARMNSERCPQKQILPIGNSCMFDICCKKLEEIAGNGIPTYVLINDNELVEIAKKYSGLKIVLRDPETGLVDGPLKYIFKDILTASKESHLMFLNDCLIFLSTKTIMEKIHEFEKSDADYATSVHKFQNWIMDENFKMLCPIDFERLSTKEISPMYQFANAFHIFNRKAFMEDGMELKEGFQCLEIESDLECIDIDTRSDYEYAKWTYENMFKN